MEHDEWKVLDERTKKKNFVKFHKILIKSDGKFHSIYPVNATWLSSEWTVQRFPSKIAQWTSTITSLKWYCRRWLLNRIPSNMISLVTRTKVCLPLAHPEREPIGVEKSKYRLNYCHVAIQKKQSVTTLRTRVRWESTVCLVRSKPIYYAMYKCNEYAHSNVDDHEKIENMECIERLPMLIWTR